MTTSPPKKGKFLAKFSFCSNQNQNVDLFVHTKICYFLKIPVTPFFFFSPFKTTHPVSHRTNILFFVCTIKYSLSEIFAEKQSTDACVSCFANKQDNLTKYSRLLAALSWFRG